MEILTSEKVAVLEEEKFAFSTLSGGDTHLEAGRREVPKAAFEGRRIGKT